MVWQVSLKWKFAMVTDFCLTSGRKLVRRTSGEMDFDSNLSVKPQDLFDLMSFTFDVSLVATLFEN